MSLDEILHILRKVHPTDHLFQISHQVAADLESSSVEYQPHVTRPLPAAQVLDIYTARFELAETRGQEIRGASETLHSLQNVGDTITVINAYAAARFFILFVANERLVGCVGLPRFEAELGS